MAFVWVKVFSKLLQRMDKAKARLQGEMGAKILRIEVWAARVLQVADFGDFLLRRVEGFAEVAYRAAFFLLFHRFGIFVLYIHVLLFPVCGAM